MAINGNYPEVILLLSSSPQKKNSVIKPHSAAIVLVTPTQNNTLTVNRVGVTRTIAVL